MDILLSVYFIEGILSLVLADFYITAFNVSNAARNQLKLMHVFLPILHFNVTFKKKWLPFGRLIAFCNSVLFGFTSQQMRYCNRRTYMFLSLALHAQQDAHRYCRCYCMLSASPLLYVGFVCPSVTLHPVHHYLSTSNYHVESFTDLYIYL